VVRPAHNSREAARRKAQKRLEGLNYTPQTAKLLSELLIILSEENHSVRSYVLGAFSEIVSQKPTWEVIDCGYRIMKQKVVER